MKDFDIVLNIKQRRNLVFKHLKYVTTLQTVSTAFPVKIWKGNSLFLPVWCSEPEGVFGLQPL